MLAARFMHRKRLTIALRSRRFLIFSISPWFLAHHHTALRWIRELRFRARRCGSRPDHSRLPHVEIIEHFLATIEFLFGILRCRSLSSRFSHRSRFLAANLAPVPKGDEVQCVLMLVEFVDDSVIASAQPIFGTASQPMMRILAQSRSEVVNLCSISSRAGGANLKIMESNSRE
jgi:hypothetical protein